MVKVEVTDKNDTKALRSKKEVKRYMSGEGIDSGLFHYVGEGADSFIAIYSTMNDIMGIFFGRGEMEELAWDDVEEEGIVPATPGEVIKLSPV